MQGESKKGIRDGGLLRAFFYTYANTLSVAEIPRLEGARGGVVL